MAVTLLAGCDDGDDDPCPPEGFENCDPIEQTCCETGGQCVIRYYSGTFLDTCLGGEGLAEEGDSCNPNSVDGTQACQTGLVCTQVQGVDPSLVCHRLCRDDADCVTGDCTEPLPGLDIKACVVR